MNKKILNTINNIDLLFDKELEELIYKNSKLLSKQD
jgi:hypothetical protein